jgi:hypothetical protein
MQDLAAFTPVVKSRPHFFATYFLIFSTKALETILKKDHIQRRAKSIWSL